MTDTKRSEALRLADLLRLQAAAAIKSAEGVEHG